MPDEVQPVRRLRFTPMPPSAVMCWATPAFRDGEVDGPPGRGGACRRLLLAGPIAQLKQRAGQALRDVPTTAAPLRISKTPLYIYGLEVCWQRVPAPFFSPPDKFKRGVWIFPPRYPEKTCFGF